MGIKSAQPNCSATKAYSIERSSINLYRSDAEKCPELMSVLSSIGTELSFCASRNLATHFAGSQYGTRGSLRPAVMSRLGYVLPVHIQTQCDAAPLRFLIPSRSCVCVCVCVHVWPTLQCGANPLRFFCRARGRARSKTTRTITTITATTSCV